MTRGDKELKYACQ